MIALRQVTFARAGRPLVIDASVQIHPGWKVGVVGANGCGKSSLFALLANELHAESGDVEIPASWHIARVAQETPALPDTALEFVLDGDLELRRVERELAAAEARGDGVAIGHLHARYGEIEGYSAKARAAEILHGLGFKDADFTRTVAEFSGGQKKRLALAQALAISPEVLLLDEPTNHLDISAIEWLEELLIGSSTSLLFITHDRRFLDRVATRIVELDRGRLASFPGSFAEYQQRKERMLADEAVHNAKFDKFLAQEELWIRKGVEARRTRNEGRVLRLEQLRRERAARRERVGRVNMALDSGEQSGKLVAELEGVSKRFGEGEGALTVVRNFSCRIQRGDKIGLIGPNGAGKTTLLRLILGELAPDSGSVRLGSKLQVAYFDQFRTQLDEDAMLADVISPGSDYVDLGGEKKHVISYLGDFLFPAQRARSPVRSLSGGERNRLLLARLFAKPANVLVLDEPTNDLDIETLELLEQRLQDYSGTLFLVSHDRTFLDNVVTQTIAAEGDGVWREYVGGYQDWADWQAQQRTEQETQRRAEAAATARQSAPAGKPAATAAPAPRSKLSYKEARELEALPGRIAELEAEQKTIAARLEDPALYTSASQDAQALSSRLAAIDDELLELLDRWETLEARV